MASAARSLRLVCRSCRSQRPVQHVGPKVFVAWKSVSGGGGSFKESQLPDEKVKKSPFDHWEEEGLEEDRKYKSMTPSQIAQSVLIDEEGDIRAVRGLDSALSSLVESENARQGQDEIRKAVKPIRQVIQPLKEAFWDDEEPDPDMITNDDSDEFEENDITDVAHAKLEETREQREYARIAIWEMPLLAKYAKPFEPPTMDQPLRFRFTSYMGEFHPAEKKVVVEFSPRDFGLSEVQTTKLIKLAGSRYNPVKETIKISCESFEHQAQNKRYLAELVEKLLAEAKDLTDTFEDVPLDLRHHKIRAKPKFPKEWRMSEERMQQIVAYREEAKQIEAAKKAEGKLVNGAQIINKALASRAAAKAAVPELVAASSQSRARVRR